MRGGKKIALSEPYKHTARQGYNGATMEKLNLKYSAQQPAQGMRTFYHNNLHGIFPLPGL
jgi:hypothetical protein